MGGLVTRAAHTEGRASAESEIGQRMLFLRMLPELLPGSVCLVYVLIQGERFYREGGRPNRKPIATVQVLENIVLNEN